MKITAIMPCRNSDWVLGLSARALLMWVDDLVMLNHASVDRTLEIMFQLQAEYGADRVHFYSSTETSWPEMDHRQRLLVSARERGATHIVTIDDDELLTFDRINYTRSYVEHLNPGYILQMPWIQLRGSIDRFITSGIWAANHASIAFVDDKRLGWHAQTNGYQHHHRHPMGFPLMPRHGLNGLLHLQMASSTRLRWKQFHYMLTERLCWPHKTPHALNLQYGPTVHTEADAECPVPREWWKGYEGLMQYLNIDAEPWQKADAQRIMRDNPGIEAGLDHFGVLG